MQDRPDYLTEHRKMNTPIIPLDSFFTQARKHLGEIRQAQESLQETYVKFHNATDTWQYYCDITYEALERLHWHIQRLCNLVLRQENNFPLRISQHWFKMIINIGYIEEQIQTITKSLTLHHTVHQSISRHILKQRKEIYFHIKTFLYDSDKFCLETAHLLNAAQFLSRQDKVLRNLDFEITPSARQFVLYSLHV